ncbi:MAG: hypothetical protein DRG30_08535, partial [Epsilonproteobacteria bacterium]
GGASTDTFAFDDSAMGNLGNLNFKTSATDFTAAGIAVNGNILVATGPLAIYADANAAATEIAANANITATNGYFIYNNTDGNNYLVHSTNLAGNGTESVLAQVNIIVGSTLADFDSTDFLLF